MKWNLSVWVCVFKDCHHWPGLSRLTWTECLVLSMSSSTVSQPRDLRRPLTRRYWTLKNVTRRPPRRWAGTVVHRTATDVSDSTTTAGAEGDPTAPGTDMHRCKKGYSASIRSISKVLRYSTHCQGISQFYLHTLHFICKRNEPQLPLSSQPQLVLIYRPRRDGRLSRLWCEVAQAEFWTHSQPIAHLIVKCIIMCLYGVLFQIMF